ncbi:MAG: hypothetical protein IKN04_23200 [Clostridia bacterium]|nr:hypothetical protein [Clostridia bacterium]
MLESNAALNKAHSHGNKRVVAIGILFDPIHLPAENHRYGKANKRKYGEEDMSYSSLFIWGCFQSLIMNARLYQKRQEREYSRQQGDGFAFGNKVHKQPCGNEYNKGDHSFLLQKQIPENHQDQECDLAPCIRIHGSQGKALFHANFSPFHRQPQRQADRGDQQPRESRPHKATEDLLVILPIGHQTEKQICKRNVPVCISIGVKNNGKNEQSDGWNKEKHFRIPGVFPADDKINQKCRRRQHRSHLQNCAKNSHDHFIGGPIDFSLIKDAHVQNQQRKENSFRTGFDFLKEGLQGSQDLFKNIGHFFALSFSRSTHS